jgi:hypothetical protein
MVLPLAEDKASPSLGEGGQDILADQRGSLLVVDERPEHLLDGGIVGFLDAEVGCPDAEVRSGSVWAASRVEIVWRIGPHCMVMMPCRPSRR